MGANGALRLSSNFSMISNANTKTPDILFGGVGVLGGTLSITANPAATASALVRNRGSQALQTTGPFGVSAGTGFGGRNSVDTSVNQNLSFTGQLATATDYIILDGYTVEVLPMP